MTTPEKGRWLSPQFWSAIASIASLSVAFLTYRFVISTKDRPWVGPESTETLFVTNAGPNLGAMIYGVWVRNSGAIPATKLTMNGVAKLDGQAIPSVQVPSSVGTLFPNARVRMGGSLNTQTVAALNDGVKVFEFEASITYSGPTAIKGETFFKYRYSPPGGFLLIESSAK